MSDEADRPRVLTAPLATAPANAAVPETTVPMPGRPGTQMSPAAAAPALDSAEEAPVPADEINGAALVRANAALQQQGEAAAVAANNVAPPEPPARARVGPSTMMSPAVPPPPAGGSTPPLAPEQAVVDVGAPAHAFAPYAGGSSPGFAPHGMMHHGAAGAGPHHGGGGAGPPMSTTFLLLVIGGVIAAVVVLAVAVGGVLYMTRRRAVVTDGEDPRNSRSPGLGVAPLRMGGARARVAVVSSGALDPDAVRAAVTNAQSRIDVCFAATELDPPNHEQASYDLEVAQSGEVRRAEPATPAVRPTKLDACVVQNLRSVRMPKAIKPSTVKLTFLAPIER